VEFMKVSYNTKDEHRDKDIMVGHFGSKVFPSGSHSVLQLSVAATLPADHHTTSPPHLCPQELLLGRTQNIRR